MNRLKGNRAYLSGAMEFCRDFGADWRKKIRTDLSDIGIIWLDPTDKPINVLDEQTLVQNIKTARVSEDYPAIARDVKLIRHIDLRMTDISDFLIVNIDLTIPTCGTWEELYNANRAKKPCLVHVAQGKVATPAWLFGVLPHQHIFSTWEEICIYIRSVDSGDNESDYNRWLFFNLTGDSVL
jgi:hypothetical protein